MTRRKIPTKNNIGLAADVLCNCCGAKLASEAQLVCPECKNGQKWFDSFRFRHPLFMFVVNATILPLLLLVAANLYGKIQRDNDDAEKHITEVRSAISELRSAETLFRNACFATISNDCRKALDVASDRYLSRADSFDFVIRQYAPEMSKSLSLVHLGIYYAENEYYGLWHSYIRCVDQGAAEEQCSTLKNRIPVWNSVAALFVADYVACRAEVNLNQPYFVRKSDSKYCEKILVDNKPLAYDSPSRLPETIDRAKNGVEELKILQEIIATKIQPGSGVVSDPLRQNSRTLNGQVK